MSYEIFSCPLCGSNLYTPGTPCLSCKDQGPSPLDQQKQLSENKQRLHELQAALAKRQQQAEEARRQRKQQIKEANHRLAHRLAGQKAPSKPAPKPKTEPKVKQPQADQKQRHWVLEVSLLLTPSSGFHSAKITHQLKRLLHRYIGSLHSHSENQPKNSLLIRDEIKALLIRDKVHRMMSGIDRSVAPYAGLTALDISRQLHADARKTFNDSLFQQLLSTSSDIPATPSDTPATPQRQESTFKSAKDKKRSAKPTQAPLRSERLQKVSSRPQNQPRLSDVERIYRTALMQQAQEVRQEEER